ncbi:MAG TPA: hypothetical protein VNH11_28880 [Pirellulales bacterium]|nr:hypothetical protein [Pirellulales bacterium]
MFDPYRKWLGIPEGRRPPTHYQLLGISPDERDTEVINAAVVRQSAYVRNFQTGKYGAEATRLLNEIAAAKLCLLDPLKRSRYDAERRNDEFVPPLRPAKAADQPPGRPPIASRPVAAPADTARRFAGQTQVAGPERRPFSSATAAWAAPVAAVPAGTGPLRPAARPRLGMPPIWVWFVLLGCCVPIALLGVAFSGRSPDSDSQATVGDVDSSRAGTVLIASGPYPSGQPGNRGPAPSSPSVSPVQPYVSVDQSPSIGAQPSSGPQATAEPISPAPPQAVPGFPNDEQVDDIFERMRAEVKAQAAERARQAQRRETTIEPPGSWPSLERAARKASSKPEKVAAARAKPARNRNRLFNPFAKDNLGQDTAFAGNSMGGGAQRLVTDAGFLVGVECAPGEFGEKCIGQLLPIFSFERPNTYIYGAIAREGYAVGAVHVSSRKYVNALQLVFMRIQDGGSLDKNDSYVSEWMGYPALGLEYTLTGDGAPVIGIHKRQGLVVDALALVVNGSAKPRGK